MILSLGSIHLLHRTQNSGVAVYLLDYQFLIQGTTQEQSDRRRAQGKGWGKGRGASVFSLSTTLSQHRRMSTSPEALQPLPLGILWRPYYIGLID